MQVTYLIKLLLISVEFRKEPWSYSVMRNQAPDHFISLKVLPVKLSIARRGKNTYIELPRAGSRF